MTRKSGYNQRRRMLAGRIVGTLTLGIGVALTIYGYLGFDVVRVDLGGAELWLPAAPTGLYVAATTAILTGILVWFLSWRYLRNLSHVHTLIVQGIDASITLLERTDHTYRSNGRPVVSLRLQLDIPGFPSQELTLRQSVEPDLIDRLVEDQRYPARVSPDDAHYELPHYDHIGGPIIRRPDEKPALIFVDWSGQLQEDKRYTPAEARALYQAADPWGPSPVAAND